MTTLYYNGKIYSMDESLNTYSAMVVCGGKIVELGDDEIISRYPDADLYDLDGKCVIPGLYDTHAHAFMAADSEGDGELFIPTSVAELLCDLKKKVATLPEGTWIGYKNTYPLRLDELRYPTKEELDAIAPNHPVAVDGFYSAQLNTCALNSLDLTNLPRGGKIMYNENGEMTGVLLNCFLLLVRYYASRKIKPLEDAVTEVMAEYNKNGFTSILEPKSHIPGINAVEKLYSEGRQTVRMRYTLPVPAKDKHEEFEKDISGISNANTDFNRLCFIKDNVDGGILTATSYMDGEYKGLSTIFSLDGVDKKTWRGNFVNDVPVLSDSIRLAQKLGLQYCAHCVGTAASRSLIEAYKTVGNTENGRHSIFHADFMSDDMIKDAKNLDLTIFFQPAWHYMDAPNIDKILTPLECSYFMPYADMLNSGIHMAAGSDHMVKYDAIKSVNPYHPFIALYNMVTCKARDGKVYNPNQKISREEALLCYTRYAAWATFDEHLFGSLVKGHRADFLILDRDYFTCPEDEIKDIKPLKTYLDGNCVYSV